jgi:hypothetical protein
MLRFSFAAIFLSITFVRRAFSESEIGTPCAASTTAFAVSPARIVDSRLILSANLAVGAVVAHPAKISPASIPIGIDNTLNL